LHNLVALQAPGVILTPRAESDFLFQKAMNIEQAGSGKHRDSRVPSWIAAIQSSGNFEMTAENLSNTSNFHAFSYGFESRLLC
jgi:hypothetical protein